MTKKRQGALDLDDPERISKLEHSNVVRGVEIFAPGTHNGDKYTEADIDEMIAAAKELDFRPALKVGHTKDEPGAPAYGWITNLRKAGGKLVADFESMHDTVVAALRDKRYDRVSSEIYFNLKRAGKTFKRALKAVALLGADVPAVAGLKPIHKMEFVDKGFEQIAACEQDLDVEKQAIIDALERRVATLTELLTAESTQREEDAMTIKELQAKKAAAEATLAEMKKKGDKMDEADKERMKNCQAQLSELNAQMKALEDGEAAKAENAALRATVAALVAKDRARDIDERVAKCTIPAFRDDLRGLYSVAVGMDTKVKVFAMVDGKRQEAEKTPAEVLDGLVEQINKGAKKLFVVEANAKGEKREDGPKGQPGSNEYGQILHERAEQRVRDGKSKDYVEGLQAVLAEDPELARNYAEEQAAATKIA